MKGKRATELESGTNASIPVFIYTTKDSRLRFLAPKHTSRLLFPSEVPHSTKRLGDRAKASWGQRTSVYPPSLYVTFHTLATSCQKVVWRASANLNQKVVLLQDMRVLLEFGRCACRSDTFPILHGAGGLIQSYETRNVSHQRYRMTVCAKHWISR